MPSIARLRGSAPAPSPVAVARPVLETAPRLLHSRMLAPQRVRSPACAAAVHRQCLSVFAALLSHPGSQRSPIPRVKPPIHPRGHWPWSWPNLAVHLVATLLLPLLCLFDTMPSSSSCFRTSLLVYHLLPVISKCLNVKRIFLRQAELFVRLQGWQRRLPTLQSHKNIFARSVTTQPFNELPVFSMRYSQRQPSLYQRQASLTPTRG